MADVRTAGLTRRQMFGLTGMVAVGGPVLLARALSRHDPVDLPQVQTGDILTAEQFNAIIDRINTLSRQP